MRRIRRRSRWTGGGKGSAGTLLLRERRSSAQVLRAFWRATRSQLVRDCRQDVLVALYQASEHCILSRRLSSLLRASLGRSPAKRAPKFLVEVQRAYQRAAEDRNTSQLLFTLAPTFSPSLIGSPLTSHSSLSLTLRAFTFSHRSLVVLLSAVNPAITAVHHQHLALVLQPRTTSKSPSDDPLSSEQKRSSSVCSTAVGAGAVAL